MLIRKIGRDIKADVVIAKCCVLPETVVLQPISELLHSGSPPRLLRFIRPAFARLPCPIAGHSRCTSAAALPSTGTKFSTSRPISPSFNSLLLMLTSSSSNVASSLIADRWAQEEFNALGSSRRTYCV
jgi:hypothetical protein